VLIFSGLGLLIIVVLALLGPATGNVFRNIYANAPSTYPRASADNHTAAEVRATPVSVMKSSGVLASPFRANRLIIKNAELNLLAADIDRAVDQIINIAVSSGGYVIGERTWTQNDLKYAAVTIGVPSDQFEIVQRQVRAVAARVLSATSSGQDVSDEYVDLEARQRNLEATAARIREFLRQASDAEQALSVNSKLTEVESELEQIKGRMTYLRDRSAYSMMTINLEPQPPAAIPTPTATPMGWQPEKTFTAATGALSAVLQGLGDAAIWLAAFVAPLAVPVSLAVVAVLWLRRRHAKRVMRNA
jgi:hypothetical protein